MQLRFLSAILAAALPKDNILSLAQRGIVNGYEDGAFRPENNITCGEYITVLYRVYAYENSDYEEQINIPENSGHQ